MWEWGRDSCFIPNPTLFRRFNMDECTLLKLVKAKKMLHSLIYLFVPKIPVYPLGLNAYLAKNASLVSSHTYYALRQPSQQIKIKFVVFKTECIRLSDKMATETCRSFAICN